VKILRFWNVSLINFRKLSCILDPGRREWTKLLSSYNYDLGTILLNLLLELLLLDLGYLISTSKEIPLKR